MTIYASFFWFFTVAMLLSGVLVILSRNAVASALCLVMMLVFVAGLYVLLEAFLLAILQVLVYAGAIMVLFLFVIMLLNIQEPRRWWKDNRLGLVGGPLAGLLFGAAVAVTLRCTVWPAAGERFRGHLADVVEPVFAHFMPLVEITAVLLLAATVGVVALGRRETKP